MKKIVVLFFLIAVAAGLSFAQQKYALVIGNGNYANITKLNNPVNDANDMEAALRGLGFTVDKVLNGTLTQMESGIVNLKNRLKGSNSSYGFFFYAGHGVQANGENYLIPVDANIQSESFLRRQAIAVQEMLDELNDAKNALNVVVLDACRDNPFPWKRSGSRGLQVVSSQPADSIIVFATSAGSTAADGTGRNGLFTSHLLNNLKTPGLTVDEVFKRTGSDVSRASNRAQIPAIYNQFFETAYLGQRPTPNTPVQPAPAPTPAPVIQPVPQSAPTPAPRPAPIVQPTPAPVPVVQPVAPPVQPAPNNMVRIQGGTFQMGSNNGNNDEKPVHQVTLSGFYMGKTEVTQKEYQAIMGTNPSNFKGDNLPVERVSWYDALVFCNKLSMAEGLSPAYSINNSTDPSNWGAVPTSSNSTWNEVVIVSRSNGYRLPTEAQWEYAARGGNGSPGNYTYSGSNNAGDVAWYKGNSWNSTHAVGTKRPNALGLYDMSGNVWEWCWDWYRAYSGTVQTDPEGAVAGTTRVARGGSWGLDTASARSVSRSSSYPSRRYINSGYGSGFRLMRPL